MMIFTRNDLEWVASRVDSLDSLADVNLLHHNDVVCNVSGSNLAGHSQLVFCHHCPELAQIGEVDDGYSQCERYKSHSYEVLLSRRSRIILYDIEVVWSINLAMPHHAPQHDVRYELY